MKSVRYAAGAVIGLAPLAAFGAPATAGAATAPAHAAGAKTKTVRPFHDFNNCQGEKKSTNVAITPGEGEASVTMYWTWSTYHDEVCVGLVYGTFDRLAGGQINSLSTFRARVWYDGSLESSATAPAHFFIPGQEQKGWSGSTTFRTWFPAPAQVCGAWLYHGAVVGVPPCITIN
jgi:hypothetical protein